MIIRRDESGFAHCPARSLGWSAVLWLIWTALLLFTLLMGILVGSQLISVPSRQTYQGALVPAADPVPIILPAGVTLEAVLVTEGDHVDAGQTLATLDREKIKERLEDLDRGILVAGITRECLHHDSRETPLEDLLPNDLSQETRLAAESSLGACHDLHARAEVAQDRIAAERRVLQDQLDVATKHNRLLLQIRPQTDAQKIRQVEAAIALASRMNSFEARLTTLTLDERSQQLETNVDLRNRMDKIMQEIEADIMERAQLSLLLNAPRLLAPVAGTIHRLRPIALGTQARASVPIMKVLSDSATQYLVHFTVPRPRVAHLPPGTPVSMLIRRMTDRPFRLHGQVTKHRDTLRAAQAGQVQMIAELTPESAAVLSEGRIGMALHGGVATTEIAVSVANIPLGERMGASWRNLLTAGACQRMSVFFWFSCNSRARDKI
ncbi:biotin/lipoyl-binding protein [Sulfitobacter sp. F26204]|uniref:biotin/lipoyl-binding protein n=1 Tax=Sulfitobacter sp. F26204 TaxID=2996014 RepID=UPI00225E13FA|nr:biotin/lipoyl-binding protein [Sulfitobacter sp. F26204]MCX7560504.1 biotin/lipoyl-binding protein [Sulfitobacter sp. F26204]